jgi:hypothetical protein
MLRSCGALFCLATVLLSSGFHTVALQGYAWLKMYDAYHQSLPASQALELTFSGDELCGICVISQDTLDDLSESLELSLGEQKPLVSLSTEPLAHSAGFPFGSVLKSGPTPELREISLNIEPPPPRFA